MVNREAYLTDARDTLKELRLVSKDFRPKTGRSDVELSRKSVDGCDLLTELDEQRTFKLSYGPIGQAKWVLRDASQLYSTLYAGALIDIPKRWKEIPFLFEPNESAKQLKLEEKYKNDVELFRTIRSTVDVDEASLKKYFGGRKTSYVNVDTHGLYQCLPQTRNNFRKIPRLHSVLRVSYSVELIGNSSGYHFEMTVFCKLSRKSPVNIAPRRGNSVDVKQIVLP